DGFRNEVQVISMVMSVDQDCPSEMAAMFGSSLALMISDIPFGGPIAGVIVGLIDGQFIINPTNDQLEQSSINLTVAGTKDAINMVEAGAKEVSEEIILEAIMFGHEEIKKLIAFQEEIAAEVGKEKSEIQLFELDAELSSTIKDSVETELIAAVQINEKQARNEAIDEVKKRVMDQYEESDADVKKQAGQILDKMVKD